MTMVLRDFEHNNGIFRFMFNKLIESSSNHWCAKMKRFYWLISTLSVFPSGCLTISWVGSATFWINFGKSIFKMLIS